MRRLRPGTARTHRFARSPFIARSAHSVLSALSALSGLSGLSGRSRLSVLSVLAALTSLALLATGCAGVEGLQSEGRARDVDAPLVLWPDYSPAPPSRDENPAALVPVPHVPRIPGGSMADANPLAVLNADIAAQGGKPPAPKAVRRPELHDLTGDGKPDLLMAVNLTPRNSELRVYSVRGAVVTRVLVLRGVLAGVELAAGHLAIREPTKDPRYVSVTDYLWDGDSMSLWNLTLDDARTSQTPRAGGGSP